MFGLAHVQQDDRAGCSCSNGRWWHRRSDEGSGSQSGRGPVPDSGSTAWLGKRHKSVVGTGGTHSIPYFRSYGVAGKRWTHVLSKKTRISETVDDQSSTCSYQVACLEKRVSLKPPGKVEFVFPRFTNSCSRDARRKSRPLYSIRYCDMLGSSPEFILTRVMANITTLITGTARQQHVD
jgi:hypothetical protein